MKRLIIIISFIVSLLMVSCKNDDPEPEDDTIEKTLFIYMPWSSNLTKYFYQNIEDFESCIEEMGGLKREKVIVFLSESPTEAVLFEIKYKKGRCERVELKSYSDHPLTTENGIAEILEDVVSCASADKYAMIIGCHGMGWLPVRERKALRSREKYHWEYDNALLTRYFGGLLPEYQTEISTLSSAIGKTGLKMEYILFDDCYMASVEVAYQLKDAADYLIASTCEIMAYGMPYATMGKHLLGTPDYKAICEDFHEFYSNYFMPCGTLSVIDLSQIDKMASIMRHINTNYTFKDNEQNDLQILDGYRPTIFYDFGGYVSSMLRQNNAPLSLMQEFEQQLNLLIPYKTNTDYFYTASRGKVKIEKFSGVTTSDPSYNPLTAEKNATAWYQATH